MNMNYVYGGILAGVCVNVCGLHEKIRHGDNGVMVRVELVPAIFLLRFDLFRLP